MADPVMDERFLIEALSAPASLEGVERLQSGALMAVINSHDRKVLREPFINLTAAAFTLHTHLGRLHMVARIHELFTREKLTEQRLVDADFQMVGLCEAERVSLLDLTKLVTQCPTSHDKVS